ncbi:MAG: hypothetical protein HYV02_04515 [Deltaproteobacteria bacterium]|nr:hypothetical protein [Deltaproteobacteria bacterium]
MVVVNDTIGGAHVAPPTGQARWVPPSRARCALGDVLVHLLRGCPDSVVATPPWARWRLPLLHGWQVVEAWGHRAGFWMIPLLQGVLALGLLGWGSVQSHHDVTWTTHLADQYRAHAVQAIFSALTRHDGEWDVGAVVPWRQWCAEIGVVALRVEDARGETVGRCGPSEAHEGMGAWLATRAAPLPDDAPWIDHGECQRARQCYAMHSSRAHLAIMFDPVVMRQSMGCPASLWWVFLLSALWGIGSIGRGCSGWRTIHRQRRAAYREGALAGMFVQPICLQQAIDSLPVGIAIFDGAMRLRIINAALRVTGPPGQATDEVSIHPVHLLDFARTRGWEATAQALVRTLSGGEHLSAHQHGMTLTRLATREGTSGYWFVVHQEEAP